MTHQKFNPFDLFWDANRANEHKQSRALGLLEKALLDTPDDVLMRVCKACLMIQMSHEWDRTDNRDSAISVALDMIHESSPATPDLIRCKIEFAVGISLAQLPTDAGFDSTGTGILEHLARNPTLRTRFNEAQCQEVFVALGALHDAAGDATLAHDAFVKGRQMGLPKAADIFFDYQQLKTLSFKQ